MPPHGRVRARWWRVVWVIARGGPGLPALVANPEARRLEDFEARWCEELARRS